MKKRKMRTVGLIMVLTLLLAGCGASSAKYEAAAEAEAPAAGVMNYATDDIYFDAMPEEAIVEEPMEEAAAESGSMSDAPKVKAEDRKLIKNVDMTVETETFDVLMQTVTEKTEALGGYVENSSVYNGSHYHGAGNRNANLTLRIPADQLNTFLATVSEVSNVVNRNENVKDVTLEYVDMNSRKEALEVEHDRLLELLEQAETVEDIIALEGRLSDVRYQMESMESRLRALMNQVSYSTVYLYIEEVAKYTPVKELSAFDKIRTGFAASLHDVGRGIKNFFIDFIISIPYLVVWAVIITVMILVLKLVLKIRKRRKENGPKEKKTKKNKKGTPFASEDTNPQENTVNTEKQ
ncbi:MAG: DUF4349 domain-containing protein [Lachnospiraceae bacterium]|nr:DUF4349 domain-containing protein [Lachnospiraceae bacterium]